MCNPAHPPDVICAASGGRELTADGPSDGLRISALLECFLVMIEWAFGCKFLMQCCTGKASKFPKRPQKLPSQVDAHSPNLWFSRRPNFEHSRPHEPQRHPLSRAVSSNSVSSLAWLWAAGIQSASRGSQQTRTSSSGARL